MRNHRAVRLLVFFATLLVLGGLFRYAPDPLYATPTFPPEITATLTLGSTTTRTLSFLNTSSTPITITFYEAEASPLSVIGDDLASHGTGSEASPDLSLLTPTLNASVPLTTPQWLVYLHENADVTPAYRIADWEARGDLVYRILTTHAAQSQARLQAELTQRGYRFQSFWVVNALVVDGDTHLAAWLSRQPEVAAVGINRSYPRQLPIPEEPGDSIDAGSLAWHLKAIGADTVWQDFGIEGAGITVATLDSGVLWTHDALRNNYRGVAGTTVDHTYNWIDTAGIPASRTPVDDIGHGTHVMGTLAGRRGTDIVQSGVAPGAQWIAVRGCGAFFCMEQDVLEAAQWLLAPTDLNGENPRPDLRPHIINNSWGFTGGGSEWFDGALEAWRAAGIFAPFAAGNSGPTCGTIDIPAVSSRAFAIGSTQRDSNVAPFSAHGPSYDGRIKPDLVAPGTGIYAPYGNGRFASLSGTSMSSPMVAGAVALLWSANPALMGDVAATEQILRDTAVPLYGEACDSERNSRPNNTFGMGLLNIAAAVRQARVDVPWFEVPMYVVVPPGETAQIPVTFKGANVPQIGSYEGRIAVEIRNDLSHVNVKMVVVDSTLNVELVGRLVDVDTGLGVAGMVEFDGGPTLQSGRDGTFIARIPRGTYPVMATAQGYLPYSNTVSITDTSYFTLPMTADLPRLELDGLLPPVQVALGWAEETTRTIEITNGGTQPLVVTPTIPSDDWQVLPLTFTTPYLLETYEVLRLENEDVYTPGVVLPFQVPLFGRYSTRLYPTSNGWIATGTTEDARRTIRCFPTGFAHTGMLAPFWADLDPSQGGTIKAGSADPDTYVISYEGIPARATANSPGTTRFTFQVVFRRNGSVEYRYGQMGTLPPRWAIGMSSTHDRAQTLACYDEPRLLGFRGWSLQNQSSPLMWSQVAESPVTISPGQSVELPVGFRGYAPSPWLTTPMHARVQLRSNDLRRPTADIHTFVTIAPAPFHTWLGFTGANTGWKE